MSLHYAKLSTSPRLQSVLEYLDQCGTMGATTRSIIQHCEVCAVSSIIAELRANGLQIQCEDLGLNMNRQRVFKYQLLAF